MTPRRHMKLCRCYTKTTQPKKNKTEEILYPDFIRSKLHYQFCWWSQFDAASRVVQSQKVRTHMRHEVLCAPFCSRTIASSNTCCRPKVVVGTAHCGVLKNVYCQERSAQGEANTKELFERCMAPQQGVILECLFTSYVLRKLCPRCAAKIMGKRKAFIITECCVIVISVAFAQVVALSRMIC